MLSRVANLIYWMARYLERAENACRILDVNTQLALDLQSGQTSASRAWEPIVHVSGDEAEFRKLHDDFSERSVVDFMIFNRRNSNSISSCIAQARENARCVREQLSTETWEQLNRLYLRLQRETFVDYQRIGSNEFLNRLKRSIQLFYGIAAGMLARSEGWYFFELGRSLERADSMSRLLDVKYYTLLPSVQMVGTAVDVLQWSAVLRSCSAFEAFRKARRGQVNAERVVDYLVLDESFPRSIRFSIVSAEEAIRRITRDSDHHFSNAPTRSLGRLRAELDYSDIKEIMSSGLHEWIDRLQSTIANIHNDVETTFFFYEVENAKVLN